MPDLTVTLLENKCLIVAGYHGHSGQWKVTVSERTPELTQTFLQASKELGFKVMDEINGKEQEGA